MCATLVAPCARTGKGTHVPDGRADGRPDDEVAFAAHEAPFAAHEAAFAVHEAAFAAHEAAVGGSRRQPMAAGRRPSGS